MALLTFSPGCTPLSAAATRTRLPGTARNRLLLLGSTAASGRLAVAALLPAVASCMRAAASTRTRCSGDDEAFPMSEHLSLSSLCSTLQTHQTELLDAVEKINSISSECLRLFQTINLIIRLLPEDDDLITKCKEKVAKSKEVLEKLHNQSSKGENENPCADASVMQEAISCLAKLRHILDFDVPRALFRDQASPTPEPNLTVQSFDTLLSELSSWKNSPPNFEKIETMCYSKCKHLIRRMVRKLGLVPLYILQELVGIYRSKLVELHDESSGEVPKADAIKGAIKRMEDAIKRMKEISMVGAPGLTRI